MWSMRSSSLGVAGHREHQQTSERNRKQQWKDKERLMQTSPCGKVGVGEEEGGIISGGELSGSRDNIEGVLQEFVRMLLQQDTDLVSTVLAGAKQGIEAYVRSLLENELSRLTWKMSAEAIGLGSTSNVFAICNEAGVRCVALKVPLSKGKATKLLHEVLIYSYLAQRAEYRLSQNHILQYYGLAAITRKQFQRLRSDEVVPSLVLEMMNDTLEGQYRRNIVTKGQWWNFTADILISLRFLRENLVIHGDIKTANILVRGDEAFLADFASALIREPDSKQGIESTLQYCSPELINGDKPSYKSDLHAAGLCLLALITRFEPYRELATMKSHSATPLNSLHETQWLMNAISKGDPIKYNVLRNELFEDWKDELRFLQRFFERNITYSLTAWITECNSKRSISSF